jgi:hypothetical protein
MSSSRTIESQRAFEELVRNSNFPSSRTTTSAPIDLVGTIHRSEQPDRFLLQVTDKSGAKEILCDLAVASVRAHEFLEEKDGRPVHRLSLDPGAEVRICCTVQAISRALQAVVDPECAALEAGNARPSREFEYDLNHSVFEGDATLYHTRNAEQPVAEDAGRAGTFATFSISLKKGRGKIKVS